MKPKKYAKKYIDEWNEKRVREIVIEILLISIVTAAMHTNKHSKMPQAHGKIPIKSE